MNVPMRTLELLEIAALLARECGDSRAIRRAFYDLEDRALGATAEPLDVVCDLIEWGSDRRTAGGFVPEAELAAAISAARDLASATLLAAAKKVRQ